MNRQEANMLTAWLFKRYPRSKLEASNLEAYAEAIVDLDRDAAANSIKALTNTSRWLPSIAEIRHGALGQSLPEPRKAADAYAELNMAVRRIGRYGAPQFRDPIMTRAVASIGWQNICDSEHEPSLRKQFTEAYSDFARSEHEKARFALVSGQTSPQLPESPVGWEEHDRNWTPMLKAPERPAGAVSVADALGAVLAPENAREG